MKTIRHCITLTFVSTLIASSAPLAESAAPELPGGKESFATAEKREDEIVAATRSAIEKNRKSDAVIRVVDSTGKSIPQAA
jgi:hypothetical protein